MKLLRIRLVKGCFLLFHQVYLAEYIVYYILQELKKSINFCNILPMDD